MRIRSGGLSSLVIPVTLLSLSTQIIPCVALESAPVASGALNNQDQAAKQYSASSSNVKNVRPQLDVYAPVADSNAVITDGAARFTILTPQLIRMEWAADGKFEDHPSFVFLNRHLSVPEFHVSRSNSSGVQRLIIQTNQLKLTYSPVDSKTDAGKFSPDNLTVNFDLGGKEVAWHPGMTDTGNLMGTARALDRVKGDKLAEPVGPGLLSKDGWAVVDDSTTPLFDSDDFSFVNGEQSVWPWVLRRSEADRQDWYFFGYGHNYKQALKDFTKVAGRIPMLPRYAFGAWWTRYWAYSDQDLNDIVRGYRQSDLPLDVMVIDMDWHTSREQLLAAKQVDQSGQKQFGWTGYTWNKELFPYPKEFLADLHQEGLKVTLNLHPASGVQTWEEAYPAMARAMGIDPTTKKYVPFDILNKRFATNYMNILHHPLEKQGVDFWWLDWQQATTSTPGVNSTWWLNYVHYTDQEREGKRGLLFGRWGGLGNHRYQTGFSGDVVIGWDSLAYQPWFTATAANVGYAYWSHDIGGHIPGPTEPELYTRWVQFGAFSPVLRTHAAKSPYGERRIWTYPEPYQNIMRDTFHLRYALQPYIYTESRRTYDTGTAFQRPLYYDWPEAPEAYTYKNEYRFGEQMIVEPVVAPVNVETQLARQSVWIPEGEWIEWPTGKHFTGPSVVDRSFSIQQIPVYVKAGAIVPMQPEMRYTGEKPVDPLILNVFPMQSGQSSSYTLYEDDGKSNAYKQNVNTWTRIKAKQTENELDVEVLPVQGQYPGMLKARAYELRLPGEWPPDEVTVNGHRLHFEPKVGQTGWRFEGNTLTTVITAPRASVTELTRIRVRIASQLLPLRSQLEGFAGSMTRLREAQYALTQTTPVAPAPQVLIDAMQTGDRLTYRPEDAKQEIAHLLEIYPQLLPAIERTVKGADARIPSAVLHLVDDPNSEAGKRLTQEFKTHLTEAVEKIRDSAQDLPQLN